MAGYYPAIFGLEEDRRQEQERAEADNGVEGAGRPFPEGAGRQFPFPVIFGRALGPDETVQAQVQVRRFEVDDPQEVHRGGYRFLAAIGMLLFIIAYFRSQRYKFHEGRDFGDYVGPFPWDKKPFAEDGYPYETLFLDPSARHIQALLRSSKESYIGDDKADNGVLSLCGSMFLVARPQSSNSSCAALFQSAHPAGPWEERIQSFCLASKPLPNHRKLSDDVTAGARESAVDAKERAWRGIRSAGPIEEESFPLAAYWRTEANADITCVSFWNKDVKLPQVLAVEAKFDYCFVDHATRFLVCFAYTESSMQWDAWNSALEHEWHIDLPLLSINFALVRSQTTTGYAVLVHLHTQHGHLPSPTIIIALRTGEVFSEEVRKEGVKIRRHWTHHLGGDLDDPFTVHGVFWNGHGGRRLAEHLGSDVEWIQRLGLEIDKIYASAYSIFGAPAIGRRLNAAEATAPRVLSPDLCVAA